ncbi:MAG: DUF4922 domain-containing protein [Bacteroides sp.]|nr:DUF4922 domain-containing protein [Bacteroides sp.]
MKEKVARLLSEQLSEWPLAQTNYQALGAVCVKQLHVGGIAYKVQYNPARIASSGAKTDVQSIQARKCFLCASNRPAEQRGIPFKEHYEVLVNPYPIFPKHLTIPDTTHTEQAIEGRIHDMLELAQALPDFTIFYNGPRCGASAPDHMHFQAGSRGFMPIETDWKERKGEKIVQQGNATLWRMDDALRNTLVIESTCIDDAERLFNDIYQNLPTLPADEEPMMNLLAMYDEGKWILYILLRRKHRPSCYTAQGNEQLLCSPASVDLGGVLILPIAEDFEKITDEMAENIVSEVCLNAEEVAQICKRIQEPKVAVGILSGKEIRFTLNGKFISPKGKIVGEQTASYQAGKIEWGGDLYDELIFLPTRSTCVFELEEVTIGIHFHWERKENQRFQGALKLLVEGENITAVNIVGVEDYLTSVISSEMSATASLELLKAHAVISRSWLLAQINKNKALKEEQACYTTCHQTEEELIRWYDREDHTLYDVCADDHCQRYQGITRASTQAVREAIEATRGKVLMHDGSICDARFSKCCGGAFEEFAYCWEEKHLPYLSKQRDSKTDTSLPDLTNEAEAEKWIRSKPTAFCNTTDKQILGQVLNNYDQETTDFYRWEVSYTQSELADLIRRRSGIDFGEIIDLQPIARGTSGRLWKLKIVGTKRSMVIGKELEIRRTLSESHLYSSAFVVDKLGASAERIPQGYRIVGAGWGHGVGLCQIGAAVMGEQGYSYDEILLHYYPGADIEKIY